MKLISPSFSNRLTHLIILTVLINMTLITGFILWFSIKAMAGESKKYHQSVMDLTEEKVEKMLSAVEVTAKNNIDEVEKGLASPSKVYAALENELKLNPHIIGFAAAFEPNYFPQQGRWFEPYVVQRDSDEIEIQQIGSASHDYLSSKWYSEAIKCKNGYWSDPYYDEAGAKMIVCSYFLPLHDPSGKVVGVFVVDVSLDWLTDQLKMIDDKNNENNTHKFDSDSAEYKSYSFILGKDGEYIVHPKEERILKENFLTNAKTTKYQVDDELAEKMLKGERGSMKIDIDGITSIVYYSPLERTGWSMAIVNPAKAVLEPGILLGIVILSLMTIGLIVVFIVCLFSIRRATKPLTYLSNSAMEVAKGHFDTPLPTIKHKDEIHQLRDSFEEMQHSLSKYVSQLQDTTRQKAAMESELNIAKSIQMSMLPKTFPPYPERKDIDIYGMLTPAKAVGGDLYDFYINNNRLYFCVGDVSGKGIPASLVMAVTRSLCRNISTHVPAPNQVVYALNKALTEGNDTNMFVTVFVGVLHLDTGLLYYCNAGHDAPILIDGSHQDFFPVDSNIPLGIQPDWEYSLQEMTIGSGNTIFLYTDGLTEAEKKDHEQFGRERMIETLQSSDINHPEAIINDMKKAIHTFVGDAEQSDDLTMLAIRYVQTQ